MISSVARSGITGTIEGIVREKESNDPLPGVTVLVVGTSYGTITDQTGRYKIVGIRAGTYTLQFKLIGYQSVTVRSVSILPDFRTQLDASLVQTSFEMAPVEITSQRPMIQRDQTSSAFQYTERDLQALPITRVSESIAMLPSTTQEGNVRGGRVGEVLYVLDGIPLQDAMAGGISVDLPKNAISSMTLWSGGFDAEFGNALSGIVNIVTKSGTPSFQAQVRYERDQWLPTRFQKQTDRASEIELMASGPLKTGVLNFFTINNYFTTDTRWWQDLQHFFSSPIKQEFTGLTRLEYFPFQSARCVVQGLYSIQRWHDYEYRWRYRLDGLPQREKDFYRITGTFLHTLSEISFYTLTLGVTTQRHHIGPELKQNLTFLPYEYDPYLQYITAGSKNWWAENQQYTWSLKADYTLQPSTIHTLKTGVELHVYDISCDLVKYEPQVTYFGKPIPSAPLLNYSNTYTYYPKAGSIYIQDKIQVEDGGSILNFGIRWDFLDPSAQRPQIEYVPVRPQEYQEHIAGTTRASLKQQFSPRFSFSVPTGPDGFVFANYGRYVQYPLFDYLYSGISPSKLEYSAKAVLAGNPDLEPERTTAWEVGVRQQFQRHWMGAITYFRKTITNQIDTKTLVPFDSKFSGDYGYASYVNLNEAHASGYECILHYENNTTKLMCAYTLMETEGLDDYPEYNAAMAQWGFAVPLYPFPLSWDQQHTIKISADVMLLWNVNMNLFAEYHTGRPYTYYPTRDGYTPLDTSKVFLPNNRRMSDFTYINVHLEKTFRFASIVSNELNLYMDVRNLLNKKNIKWMDSNGQVGGELGDPSAYDDPRRVRIGVIVKF